MLQKKQFAEAGPLIHLDNCRSTKVNDLLHLFSLSRNQTRSIFPKIAVCLEVLGGGEKKVIFQSNSGLFLV